MAINLSGISLTSDVTGGDGVSGGVTAKMKFIPVTTLPSADKASKSAVYLVPAKNATTKNKYDEYVVLKTENGYIWELFGQDVSVDLQSFATKADLNKKQDKLVNQQNIRSINNVPLVGAGNVNFEVFATAAEHKKVTDFVDNAPGTYATKQEAIVCLDITSFSQNNFIGERVHSVKIVQGETEFASRSMNYGGGYIVFDLSPNDEQTIYEVFDSSYRFRGMLLVGVGASHSAYPTDADGMFAVGSDEYNRIYDMVRAAVPSVQIEELGKKPNGVQTVNGAAPDENGNINLNVMTDEQKQIVDNATQQLAALDLKVGENSEKLSDLEGEIYTDAITNKYDPSTISAGKRVNYVYGSLSDDERFFTSDFIPVKPGQKVMMLGGVDSAYSTTVSSYCWFKENKTTAIKGETHWGQGTIKNVPNDVAFLRFVCINAYIDTIMILVSDNEFEAPTEFVPFGEHLGWESRLHQLNAGLEKVNNELTKRPIYGNKDTYNVATAKGAGCSIDADGILTMGAQDNSNGLVITPNKKYVLLVQYIRNFFYCTINSVGVSGGVKNQIEDYVLHYTNDVLIFPFTAEECKNNVIRFRQEGLGTIGQNFWKVALYEVANDYESQTLVKYLHTVTDYDSLFRSDKTTIHIDEIDGIVASDGYSKYPHVGCKGVAIGDSQSNCNSSAAIWMPYVMKRMGGTWAKELNKLMQPSGPNTLPQDRDDVDANYSQAKILCEAVANGESVDVIFIQNGHYAFERDIHSENDVPFNPTQVIDLGVQAGTTSQEEQWFANNIASLIGARTKKVGTLLKSTWEETKYKFALGGTPKAGVYSITLEGRVFNMTLNGSETLNEAVLQLSTSPFDEVGWKSIVADNVIYLVSTTGSTAAPNISYNAGTTGLSWTASSEQSTSKVYRYFNSRNTNDWGTASKWEKVSNWSNGYSMIAGTIELLQQHLPKARIILTSMIGESIDSNSFKDALGYNLQSWQSSHEYKVRNINGDKSIEIAKRYSIETIDLRREAGISINNFFTFFNPNDVHPKKEGYEKWAEAICQHLGV